jgi:hypothetical protein
VDAIKITKTDFLRLVFSFLHGFFASMLSSYCLTCDFPCYYSYAKSSTTKGLQQSLKLKHKINMLRNAKSLIRLQTNLTTRILEKGEVVYAEGDVGDSMFHVDEYDGGEVPQFLSYMCLCKQI